MGDPGPEGREETDTAYAYENGPTVAHGRHLTTAQSKHSRSPQLTAIPLGPAMTRYAKRLRLLSFPRSVSAVENPGPEGREDTVAAFAYESGPTAAPWAATFHPAGPQ